MTKKALSGIEVLDCSQGINGAYCARILADLGANVVKVEHPSGGDPTRQWGPFQGGEPHPERSGLFLHLNTNKRGITLDLANPQDRETLLRLVQVADVLVENYPPQQMERWGIAYEQLRKANPGLVMTSITPFGQTGPYRGYKATDLITFHAAVVGYVSPHLAQDPERQVPLKAGGHIANSYAGAMAALATLCAIHWRRYSGKGQHLDISEQEAFLHTLWHILMAAEVENNVYHRVGRGRIAPICRLPCRDGFIVMQLVEEHQWHSLVALMGNPDWARWDMFKDGTARGANWDALEPLLVEWLGTQDREQLFHAAQKSRVPISPVYTPPELLEDRFLAERGFFADIEHLDAGRVRQPSSMPCRLSATPLRVERPAPRLGQDNPEVVGRLVSTAQGTQQPRRTVVLQEPAPTQRDVGAGFALAGLRMLDFTWAMAGPSGTVLLADMGMEVIKVESVKRPNQRQSPPFADGRSGLNRSGFYSAYNRGKLGVTLDLTRPEAIEIARRLVTVSDIVVDNFSPPVMRKLGLDYPALARLKPDIIVCSLSGFGATGSYREYVSYGYPAQAFGGLYAITGYPGGPPEGLGTPVADTGSGLYAALAIMAAVDHRLRTGEGQFIDVSMAESMLSMAPEGVLEYALKGTVKPRIGNRDEIMAPHGVYRCNGNDQWVAIAVSTDAEWRALCHTMERPDLARDERFSDARRRQQYQDELDQIISLWTRGMGHYDAALRLQQAGVAAGPVLNAREALEDPHLTERGYWVRDEHPEVPAARFPGLSWKMSVTTGGVRRHAPLLGEDNGYVLGELLGLPKRRMDALISTGIVC